jgi:hypothetical protein
VLNVGEFDLQVDEKDATAVRRHHRLLHSVAEIVVRARRNTGRRATSRRAKTILANNPKEEKEKRRQIHLKI